MALLLVLALALAACGRAEPDASARSAASADAARDEGSACGVVEETVDAGHHHLVGDAEPPTGYATVPPTSGWHYRERDRIVTGVRDPDDPLTESEQVSVLAVGGVVVSYHEVSDEDRRGLADFVAAQADRLALTPYDRLEPGQVALTAWRTRQFCSGFDEAAAGSFVDEHAADELDYDMGGHAPGDH